MILIFLVAVWRRLVPPLLLKASAPRIALVSQCTVFTGHAKWRVKLVQEVAVDKESVSSQALMESQSRPAL